MTHVFIIKSVSICKKHLDSNDVPFSVLSLGVGIESIKYVDDGLLKNLSQKVMYLNQTFIVATKKYRIETVKLFEMTCCARSFVHPETQGDSGPLP